MGAKFHFKGNLVPTFGTGIFVGFLTPGKALIDEGAHSGCDSAKREGGRKCHDPVGDTVEGRNEGICLSH